MRDVGAKTGKTLSQTQRGDVAHPTEPTSLDGRYGRIGISAVAAAARYQGARKNPAYAPASNKWRDQFAEVSA